jgi:hypothetical protein
MSSEEMQEFLDAPLRRADGSWGRGGEVFMFPGHVDEPSWRNEERRQRIIRDVEKFEAAHS